MFNILTYCNNYNQTKILIVDDEPNIVRILQDRLQMNEYTVLTANNGKDGLELAALELPDIILLDITMPVMDGHEMLEKLRTTPGCHDIAVIMLTARSQAEDIKKAEKNGIVNYIVKPFALGDLLEKIECIIENQTNDQMEWRTK